MKVSEGTDLVPVTTDLILRDKCVRGKVILQSQGKEFFTSRGNNFFT